MEKKEMVDSPKSSRMVGYLAAAVALLAVAFIVLIGCATYLIENSECEEMTTAAAPATAMASPESCHEYHYEGSTGNTTYIEYTTVCESTNTEFGVVRDKNTGFVMNTFFMDYKERVSVVYLAKSHTCLLTHDMGMNSFEEDLENYRNDQYGQGPYEYHVGDAVHSWDEIPQDMRGFCSPRNTFRWLTTAPEEETDDGRGKRSGMHLCCCWFISGGRGYISWACGNNIGCTFGSACYQWVFAHYSICPPSNPAGICTAFLYG